MKKKIKAFTLIELLVVISIITIISGVSINGFFNFSKNNNTKAQLTEIIYTIENLDKKVKNHEIFDYEIIFKNNYNDKYIIYENIFDENKNQKVSNISNENIEIVLNGLEGEAWIKNIYKNNKLFSFQSTAEANKIINYDNGYDYKILGVLSGSLSSIQLNNIEIKNYDKNNLDLNLIKISETIGGSDLGEIKIRNIGGKKDFYDNLGNVINSPNIYLFFQNASNENYLIIDK